MLSKRRTVALKDQDIPAQKAKEIKGGIIAVLIGLSATQAAQSAATADAGKVHVSDLLITKKMDCTSTMH